MATAHRYTITPKNPGAHLFEVELTVAEPDPAGQLLTMPAWIPGSYKIRDFAKHVVSIRAESEGEEVELTKLDKSSWQCAPREAPVSVTVEVFAYDLNVRGAHLDKTHAFFNGSCVFLAVDGQEDRPCELTVRPPPDGGGDDWRVATSMPSKDAGLYGFGTYLASDYAELIDHPFEIGNVLIGEFEAAGIPHAIAVQGDTHFDMRRICHDLATLCEHHLRFLGTPHGLERYLFLLTVVDSGYGGLEHRCSSSLLCSRADLPRRGDKKITDGYRKFLGLCSHEYFHLWNVKRMKPERFTPYDLRSENYTGLLWVFEGITSYYDDLALARSGLISAESYLELLAKTVTRVMRTQGRFRQSVEESSFETWTKFYQQDANASNAIVSYYSKGSLVALALDLTLRKETDGACDLDAVMRECWKRYGETGDGMPERGLESVTQSVSGLDLADFFERYVRGTADLPLENLLRDFGVKLHLRPANSSKDEGGKPASDESSPAPWLGAKLVQRGGRQVFSVVHAGSPAEVAGVAPGDEAVAFGGLRITAGNIDARLGDHHAGDTVPLKVFRRDALLDLTVQLAEPPDDTCYMELDPDPASDAKRRRQEWLSLD